MFKDLPKSRVRAAKIAITVFGVIPATALAIPAALLFVTALDRIQTSVGLVVLGVIWGGAALVGTVSAWYCAVYFEKIIDRRPKVVSVSIVLGVLAATLALAVLWPSLSGFAALVLISPIVVGLLLSVYFSEGGRLNLVGLLALSLSLVLLSPKLYDVLRDVNHINVTGTWTCGNYGSCEEFVAFSIGESGAQHQIVTEYGLLEHLRSVPSEDIQIQVSVECLFGQYRGYMVTNLAGFDYSFNNWFESEEFAASCD
ncbi:MAG: hypothetical protein AAF351_06945 [Pseudomonadota bacterium]